MRKNEFFGKRIIFVYIAVVIAMFSTILRIYTICSDKRIKASATENCYRIKLADIRKTVFDCRLMPVTNKEKKILAVVSPIPRAITALSSALPQKELEEALSVLRQGKPAVVELDKKIECDGILCVEVYNHNSSDMICPQLIGYVNDENHGVMGIEKAYDDMLYSDEDISVLLASDGSGKLLYGAQAEIEGDVSAYNSGIALTIDSSIQSVVQNAVSSLKSGAAIVEEVGTGKIKAMVSVPQFDTTKIDEYLKSTDSPFINRALKAYNVGSAFKPCVAAAILEQGKYSDFSIDCTGSTTIDGHVFKCHKLSGHGTMNLRTALEQSCNVFFYNVSQKVSAQAIYNMASSFMFGSSINLGGISADAGSLTSLSKLKSSPHALANLSIGQGELLLSPVAMLTMYEAIANGGVYHMPSIIEGTVERGILKPAEKTAPTRVMSADTANTIKDYLSGVLSNGTGKAAKPELCSAAGKTATAETGWVKDGKLITNSWFCGFFPCENPKYVVIVMIDDLEKNGVAGAPVFQKIADGITLLEKSRNNAIK